MENEERRRGSDRRRRPTPIFSRYTLVGRRGGSRRADDPQEAYYVDRIGKRAWLFVWVLVVLSFVDGAFTIYFLEHHKGFQEANPFMRIALFLGNEFFIFVKYILTILGALVVCLHRKFRFVRWIAFSLLVFYLLLDGYHLYLFFTLF